jgi:hypothetical protein
MDQRDRRTALVRDKEFLRRCVGAVLLLIGLVVATPASAQQAPVPEVSFPILVTTDADDAQVLTFGYDPSATNSGIDGQFLETEQPPPPPPFDARLIDDEVPPSGFGEGLLIDIRQGASGFTGTKKHEIKLQPSGANSITFEWNLPSGVTGTLKDVVTDGGEVNESMEGQGSYTLTNTDITELFVTLDYDGTQPSINIQSQFVGADGTFDFKNTGADIGFSGVGTSGAVTLTKYRNGPDGTDNIDENNVSEYRYVIESGDLSFSDATLRLADSTLAGMTNPNTVEVYRRDPPGSGSFERVVNTEGGDSEVRATTSGLGEFVLASDDSSNPLPVELAQFTVRRDEETALVQWRTATETNNAGFEVQHRGPGAEDYAEAGYVESKADGGTTTQPTSYRYEVTDLNPGTHQFRLRQVDTDGTAHLSEPVSLTVGMEQSLRLTGPSPNPVRTSTQIRFGVQGSAPATVELYNVLGQRVATLYDGTPAPGEMQTVRLGSQELAGVPSGVYFVRLDADGASRTRRLTVVR